MRNAGVPEAGSPASRKQEGEWEIVGENGSWWWGEGAQEGYNTVYLGSVEGQQVLWSGGF